MVLIPNFADEETEAQTIRKMNKGPCRDVTALSLAEGAVQWDPSATARRGTPPPSAARKQLSLETMPQQPRMMPHRHPRLSICDTHVSRGSQKGTELVGRQATIPHLAHCSSLLPPCHLFSTQQPGRSSSRFLSNPITTH